MANVDQLEQMYKDLVSNMESLKSSSSVINLSNDDFLDGTYIIDKPGVYRLTETIVFNPNSLSYLRKKQNNSELTSYQTSDVLETQLTSLGGKYDPSAYGIGFFAAIAIQTNDVLLDLNGFTIEQSAEHNLQQRFYSHIELADQPFIPRQGPHDFGSTVKSAKNCYIINGKLGSSSHHHIHGNSPENILIQDITFNNYEVAAISIHGGKNIAVNKCTLKGSKTDIPTVGIWSSSRFIRNYINKLVKGRYNGVISVNGMPKTANEIQMELRNSMENVYNDLIVNKLGKINKNVHLSEWRLFTNPERITDGNNYGIIFNSLGVAVNGFPSDLSEKNSTNIYLNKIHIQNHFGNIKEVPALPSGLEDSRSYGSSAIVTDPVGAVFQTLNKDPDGKYITINEDYSYLGNVVANAQVIVAKAIYDGFNFGKLSTSTATFNQKVINWVEGRTSFLDVVPNKEFFCNGDSMFHVNKGVIGYKLDNCSNLYSKDCTLNFTKNFGKLGTNLCSVDYKNKIGISHPSATYSGYNGANVRGVSICSSKDVTLENCELITMNSDYGFSYGYDIHQKSQNIWLVGCSTTGIFSGILDDSRLQIYNNNPTHLPVSIGFHVQEEATEVYFCEPNVGESIGSTYKTIPFSINCQNFYDVNRCDL